jgi:hypothetical protein
VGAVVALSIRRHVIIVGTAFAGAWTLIVGVLEMQSPSIGAAMSEMWLAYPTSPSLARVWIIVAWLAISVAGVIVQFRFTGRAPSRRRS